MTKAKVEVDREALRERLTPEQYHVTQEKGTERPFSGALVHHKEYGIYSCVVCETVLFSSEHKYDSGSGWPSFWLAMAEDRIRTEVDESHGMRREEVLCANCDSHLGHVFPDGPEPTGLRFCINSASLTFSQEDDSDTPANIR